MTRFMRFFLSVSSGVLLSLAWLGFPGWILFIALVPLFMLDHFFIENRSRYRGVAFWSHAFLAFLIWNGLTTWWIAYATLAGAVMAIVVNSFLMSLVWWLGHTARRQFRSDLGYLALIAFWISFEYFHFHWDIEWPWLNLGNGFANNVKMIQWYEFTGTLGGTLWVLILNALLFGMIRFFMVRSSLKDALIRGMALMVLLVGPIFVSYMMYTHYTEEENPLNIVVVQPNTDPYSEQYDEQAENEKLKKFLRLAAQRTDDQTDLVIGPETVFERYPDWNTDHLAFNFQFQQVVEWMRNYPQAEIIFGASTSKIYPDAKSATQTARERNGMIYDVFNSAIFINRLGREEIYHKSILVVGVEKTPFRNYIGFLSDLVFDLGGTSASLGKQEEPSNFELKDGTLVAPVICYESVFGAYLTKYVRKGAGLIVIITNDGWWRNTPGYKQHFSFARLRAIETRRSVARSANTGISGFINQRGDVVTATAWWTEATAKEKVNVNDKITFYVKYGDYIARIALFVGGMLLLLMLVRRIIRTKKSASIPFA